jgi:3-oxoacyl-[acyl-carrier protein] reductase
MTVAGKTALVTGAARGIGLAIATRLAADGARVALLDQDADAVETAARGIGRGALALAGDVTRAKDVDGAVARVEGAWGRLDVLVNNAGLAAGHRRGPHQRLPLLPGRGEGDAAAGRGPHRQHRLDRGEGGQSHARAPA